MTAQISHTEKSKENRNDVGFRASDGIGLNEAPSFVSYRFQSGLQCRARYPAFAILLMNNEASDSTKFLCALGGKASILARVVDPGKLLLGMLFRLGCG